jgi:hypothetical protein
VRQWKTIFLNVTWEGRQRRQACRVLRWQGSERLTSSRSLGSPPRAIALWVSSPTLANLRFSLNSELQPIGDGHFNLNAILASCAKIAPKSFITLETGAKSSAAFRQAWNRSVPRPVKHTLRAQTFDHLAWATLWRRTVQIINKAIHIGVEEKCFISLLKPEEPSHCP